MGPLDRRPAASIREVVADRVGAGRRGSPSAETLLTRFDFKARSNIHDSPSLHHSDSLRILFLITPVLLSVSVVHFLLIHRGICSHSLGASRRPPLLELLLRYRHARLEA